MLQQKIKNQILLRGPPFNLEKSTDFKIGGIWMRNAPNKIFMLEDGKYIEIKYDYYQILVKENPMRRFWLFGGMLMEVSEEDYVQMNREKSRIQYQAKWQKR